MNYPLQATVSLIESVANHGYLFHFLIDDMSPDKPDLECMRHYYVVSTYPSCESAYCYLALSLCGLKDNTKLGRWLTLYCHLFPAISLERFLEILLGIVKKCISHYAVFADEYTARLVLHTPPAAADEVWRMGEGRERESLKHLVHTPRDAEAANPVERFLTVDKLYHVETGPLNGNASPETLLAKCMQLEDCLRESGLLLQMERNQHERETAALRAAAVEMRKELDWRELKEKQRTHHHYQQQHFSEHQGDTKYQEREPQFSHSAVRDQEGLLQQLVEENASLKLRHYEASIEIERWHTEYQTLKHTLNRNSSAAATTAMCPVNSVSREQYCDLDRRHHLLHREFDELSLERADMDQQLQHARQELSQRRGELDRALRMLKSLRNGLDYVGRTLPLVSAERLATGVH